MIETIVIVTNTHTLEVSERKFESRKKAKEWINRSKRAMKKVGIITEHYEYK